MLKRKGTGWMDGSFSIPAGGLDAGETIHSAAIREAYEEVSVQIASDSLEHVHTLHGKTDGQTWIGHFFRTTAWEGTPVLRELDKHGDLQWRPLNALPSETIPYVRQALSCVAARRPYQNMGGISANEPHKSGRLLWTCSPPLPCKPDSTVSSLLNRRDPA